MSLQHSSLLNQPLRAGDDGLETTVGTGDTPPPLARSRSARQRLSDRFIQVFPPMTTEQELSLSPWEKYRDFNRFPFKFVLQFALLALVTAQVAFWSGTVLPYFNQSSASLAANFYGFQDASGAYHSPQTDQPGSRGISNQVFLPQYLVATVLQLCN